MNIPNETELHILYKKETGQLRPDFTTISVMN